MPYRFEISLTDEDYLELNKFMSFTYPKGKKQFMTMRLVFTLVMAAIALISLAGGGFTADAFIGVIPYIILAGIYWFGLRRFCVLTIKSQMKQLRKNGKMPYSPESVLEFHEDRFVESTPENRTENAYSAIERISIVEGQAIYIHINAMMGYIIPASAFKTDREYLDLKEFLRTKSGAVDIYTP